MSPNRIEALSQHPDFLRLAEALAPHGLRLVGGCVRDAILGIPSEDMDMATTLTPDEVMATLSAKGFGVKPTGIEFGTVTALIQHRPYEITSLREDMECNGRHVKVRYTTDWQQDAARRDFTMNALYLDREGKVQDFFDGIADAKAGRLRFVGEAAERIREDYLRVLRYFRFYTRYGREPMEPVILDACRQAAPQLAQLSAERIQKEMLKTLNAPEPAAVLTAMQDCGVLTVVVPSLHAEAAARANHKLNREKRYETYLDQSHPAVALRRLAYLLYQPVLSLDPLIERWKLSRQHQKWLQLYCTQRHTSLPSLARTHGTEHVWNILLVQGSDAELEEAAGWLPGFNPPAFPLSGDDVMARFPELKGKALGEALKAAEDIWEGSGYQLEAEALIAEIGKLDR